MPRKPAGRGGPRAIAALAGLVGLALVPPLAQILDQPFYVELFRRTLIFALAAVSLDLILGFGGMVSLGHAAYLGIGAYAVAVPAHYGWTGGVFQWVLAVAASMAVAAAIGAVSLRTSGVSFIMITLAFTQMLYYLGIGIEEFGGDNGMRLPLRSQFGPLVPLARPIVFYYVVLAILALAVYGLGRVVHSRFGMILRGSRSNEGRMQALGVSTYRYRLAAFAISGGLGGLAGALLVNQTEYLTPDFMHWTRSGEILFMVILGGMGTLIGPVVGAIALLLLETVLSAWTEHWQILLGPILVLVVVFAKRGLYGLLPDG